MRHCKSQASEIVRRGTECGRGDVVEPSTMWRRNIERHLRVLHRISHTEIQPQGNFQLLDRFHRLLAYRLPHRQSHSGRDVGQVLAKDEDSVRLLDLPQGWRPHRTAPEILNREA